MSFAFFRDLLAEHFNLSELRLLCRDLGIEYEDLSGDTRQLKAQSLVEYCQRHGRSPSLTARCRELRPAVHWPELDSRIATTEGVEENQPSYIVHHGIIVPNIAWGGVVPAGTYVIGDASPKPGEGALRPATIAAPFQLARYPTTVAQYARFTFAADVDEERWWVGMPEDQKYEARMGKPRWSEPDRPRENITWYQAIAFCRWLDYHLREAGLIRVSEKIDLPHEEEWEAAVRYTGNGYCDQRAHPWGNTLTINHANYSETGLKGTSRVNHFPAGRQPELGLYDLNGNVWEWCRNKYDKPQEIEVDGSGEIRTMRGGSWTGYPASLRAAYRHSSNPGYRAYNVGFRVAMRRSSSHYDQ